jgi:hypothetical protein
MKEPNSHGRNDDDIRKVEETEQIFLRQKKTILVFRLFAAIILVSFTHVDYSKTSMNKVKAGLMQPAFGYLSFIHFFY